MAPIIIFVVAMVAMAVSARIHMTIDGRIIRVNVVASTLVAYLVLTSLITVRDASARQRAIDAGAAGLVLVTVSHWLWRMRRAHHG